jgi:hypothetical protein
MESLRLRLHPYELQKSFHNLLISHCWMMTCQAAVLGLLGRSSRSFERLLSLNPEDNIQLSLYLKVLKGQSNERL